MNVKNALVLGDSVTWGQGLLPQHKIDFLITQKLGDASTIVERRAHSGAVIGVGLNGQTGAPDGEIPDSYPTILTQSTSFTNAPESLDLVLLNGGINDIDIRTILNPTTSFKSLGDRTKLHCYDHMVTLLSTLGARCPSPSTKIVVVGYYPILSTDSELMRILPMLEVHGIGIPSNLYNGPILDKVISLCMQFWNDSNMWLERAVTDANASDGHNRMIFIRSPLSEKNSVFATDPWLWGVNADLGPQDEVSKTRGSACQIFYCDEGDWLSKEQCFRASAGHPNVAGAAAIASAITAQLDT